MKKLIVKNNTLELDLINPKDVCFTNKKGKLFMIKNITVKRTTLILIAFAVLAFGLVIGTSITSAESGTGSGQTLTPEKQVELEKKKQERQVELEKKMEEHKAELESKKTELEAKHEENKEKFTEKRLEACKKKEARINQSMQKIAERKTKQVEVFNKIAERTMNFYEEKGLTLANYDALVTDVTAKEAIVEAEIANLKSSTVDFKCDSDDPLKVSDVFKSAREGVVTAMKEYKTAVKNLVVGVKSVASTTEHKEGDQ